MQQSSLEEGWELLTQAMKKLPNNNVAHLLECREALFTYCPFRVGEEVMIAQELDIGPKSGWYIYANLLKKGTKADVSEVGYADGAFRITIVPQGQTAGRCTPAAFTMPASQLVPAPTSTLALGGIIAAIGVGTLFLVKVLDSISVV